jgi:hypothetical protein
VFCLQGIKDHCEQIIKCIDNCVELMEIAFPGIFNESRERYEQLVLVANQPIEKIVGELLEASGVTEVLKHDGETPASYTYPNLFAQPGLEQLWTVPTTEGST